MVSMEFKPGAAGRKAQTNPLSYGSTPSVGLLVPYLLTVNFKKAERSYPNLTS